MEAAAFLTRSPIAGGLQNASDARSSRQRRAILVAADRARNPPTSSSLADEKRVRSLLLSTAARDPRFTARSSGVTGR
jgi:hypothetical protein